MWFPCTETYWWSVHTSSSFVIDWCWHFFVENILKFQYCFWLLTDVDYFSCANCSHHFWLMFMWFPCTETYWWSVHTSSSFVIDWCWHFFVENILEFQYCFWLLTDVDYFSCAKYSCHSWLMFMWFSCTETYRWSVCTSSSFLIYLCWHIFVLKMFQSFNFFFDYLLMLNIFHVQNVVIIFDWCLCDFLVLKHIDGMDTLHLHLSMTDVDIFLWKIF